MRLDAAPHVPVPAAEILVRDSGAGIAPEHLAHVWEPYVTHKAGGTGLGMAMARQTVEAHRGTVELRSVAGKGTDVRFTLPVSGTSGSPSGEAGR
jgi:signal transduction histidine kinase